MTTDLSIPVSMSTICPTTEVDELTVCLLTIFEQRGLMFELFGALIRHEIGQTGMEVLCSLPSAASSRYVQQKTKLRFSEEHVS